MTATTQDTDVWERRAIEFPRRWFKKVGITQQRVAQDLGLSLGTFSSWIYTKGGRFPYAVWLEMEARWGAHGYGNPQFSLLVNGVRLPAAFAKHIPQYRQEAETQRQARQERTERVERKMEPKVEQQATPATTGTLRHDDPSTWPSWLAEAVQLMFAAQANAIGARHEVEARQKPLEDRVRELEALLQEMAVQLQNEQEQKNTAVELAGELDEQNRKLEAQLATRGTNGPAWVTDRAAATVQAIAGAAGAGAKAKQAEGLGDRLGK